MQEKWKRLLAALFARGRTDLPASLVVFLVALPLCMGVAIASGVPVAAGLIAGIVGGIVVGALAGAPLQVSGPAAGLTVLVYQVLQSHGIESLGVLVLACGVLQIVFGLCRLGVWFRAVSPAVIHGMMAGIGVLILAGQFHVMVDDKPKGSGLENLLTIPEAVQKGFPPPALETAEQRAAVRRSMERLSGLHQRQLELWEQVHHLLAGAAPAEPSPTAAAAPAPEPRPTTDAVSDSAGVGGKIDAELADLLAEEEAESDAAWRIAGLQALAPAQRRLLEELQTLRGDRSAAALATAVRAAETALADLEGGEVHRARASQDEAERALRTARDTTKHHRWAATVGILTIVLLVGWQVIVGRRFKAMPAALASVGVMTAAATIWQLPLTFVEVPERLFDEIFFPNFGELAALADPRIFFIAVEFAIVASAETLLSATAVDRLHSGPRTQYDRELMAQGVGNICCGLLRALPVTGVIVRSSINVENGARSRLSAVLHGVWILVFVVAFAGLLRLVPISALAAVLVYTGYKLIDFRGWWSLWRHNRFESLIFLTTALIVVSVGLLQGVLAGVALSIAKLLWEFSRLEIALSRDPDSDRYILTLRGNATFLRLPLVAQALAEVPHDAELHLNVEDLDLIDHACRDLLHDWARENEPLGGKLVLDQDSLAARFWRRPRRLQGAAPAAAGRPRRERQVPI